MAHSTLALSSRSREWTKACGRCFQYLISLCCLAEEHNRRGRRHRPGRLRKSRPEAWCLSTFLACPRSPSDGTSPRPTSRAPGSPSRSGRRARAAHAASVRGCRPASQYGGRPTSWSLDFLSADQAIIAGSASSPKTVDGRLTSPPPPQGRSAGVLPSRGAVSMWQPPQSVSYLFVLSRRGGHFATDFGQRAHA